MSRATSTVAATSATCFFDEVTSYASASRLQRQPKRPSQERYYSENIQVDIESKSCPRNTLHLQVPRRRGASNKESITTRHQDRLLSVRQRQATSMLLHPDHRHHGNPGSTPRTNSSLRPAHLQATASNNQRSTLRRLALPPRTAKVETPTSPVKNHPRTTTGPSSRTLLFFRLRPS